MRYDEYHLDRVRAIRVYRQGDRRAPHKPLLLLIAIARLLRGQRDLPFNEVECVLGPLLRSYAPPVRARHQPELPYWHLCTDGLWEIPGADDLPRQAGGFPRLPALRTSTGHLAPDFADALLGDRQLVDAVIAELLDSHFAESLHEDIIAAVGLELPMPAGTADRAALPPPTSTRPRDPHFRQRVLRAYEHRCAVTGFRAALGGLYLGCEAAHVQWHAYEGPDTVANGLAVEPTLHKLLDAGAWSLTDDRRVLVSAELTGTDETVERIRGFHGQAIRAPLAGEAEVDIEFIRWHREPELGGVFREPGLPL